MADVAANKKAGPFDRPPFKFFSVSPIGAVPKKGTNKIRVIHHLSHPFKGDSINHSITEKYQPLGNFDQACVLIRRLGRGCSLIKLDAEAAYKQVPVPTGRLASCLGSSGAASGTIRAGVAVRTHFIM